VKAAGFPREKWLGDFDFDANPNINPATIHTLATGDWIRRGHPLCLIGDSGTGKPHLLIALGTVAAEEGFRVRYTLATRLVNELVEGADERILAKTITRYGRVDLLCIDELGLHGTRPPRRRTPLPGPHRTRSEEQHRHRQQPRILRLDPHLHRHAALRRDRRPADVQRRHHRNRHRLLPTGPHQDQQERRSEATAGT
jgi:hypothetical protein